MINKVFKTILILMICLGLTIPTNAAVSVSDGSAFVTKAEFAADLNNLSNRMAQLENSLDAKIDSLVSSYLTRNGIWNGAKQTLAKSDGASWCNFMISNDKTNINSLAQPAINEYLLWSYVGHTTTESSYNFCTSNKSGLMLITMRIVGNMYNRYYFKPTNTFGSSATACSLLWKYFVNGVVTASIPFGSISTAPEVRDYTSIQRVIGIFDQKLSSLFFVAKGDNITYDIVVSAMWGVNPGTKSDEALGSGGPDSYGYAYVDSCDVY